MGYDARREDYQRMSLRFSRSLDDLPSNEAARAYASFSRRFAHDYDNLPQTDEDRAFHLVAKAAVVIDYELPYADDVAAQALIDRGHDLLGEALSLDRDCIDARRMLAASSEPGFDAFYTYLAEGEEEVDRRCHERAEAALDEDAAERADIAKRLALRPYLRWLASMASQAIICGRNREALRVCEKALLDDPLDETGVRETAVLAFAKLEDEQGIKAVDAAEFGHAMIDFGSSPWSRIAHCNVAYKRRDFSHAEMRLKELIALYPHACAALIRQHEFPEGVFSRIGARPASEDELLLALSESAILLQEGREVQGRGPFGNWVAETAERLASRREAGEIAKAKRFAAEKAAMMARQEREGYEGFGGSNGSSGPGGSMGSGGSMGGDR
jgi:hypothetical protein